MTIIFEPKFGIGDVVSLRVNPERKMVVGSYWIGWINENGEVTYYTIDCVDKDGELQSYRPVEIELVEVA